MQKRLICLALCLLLCCLICGCTPKSEPDEATLVDAAIAEKIGCEQGHVLSQKDWFPAGSASGDWLALTFRTAGIKEDYEAYLADLESYVTTAYAQQGCLDKTRATEYHRIALTVHALGGDPFAFGTHPDGKPVDLIEDGVIGFANLEAQGLNSVIYALLALDTCGSKTAESEKVQTSLLQTILDAQESDGGFGLTAGASETDVTAMALQALAPHREACADNVSAALDYLADQITSNGTFTFMQTENGETTAQVLLALCALGINPETDAHFAALPAGLARFRLESGLYRHTTDDPDGDMLSTQQCLLASIALQQIQS